jgi:acetyltransferase-like isoleucine patch superfamily enzyme
MRFKDWQYPNIEEGKPTRYNWVVQHLGNFKLGRMTDIGAFTYINAKNGVTLEDYVQLGSHCSIYSVSTIDGKKGEVILRRNCCIGTHSTVMPGVTIGENSIVGAHSLVTSDIPDNSVAYGIPAKVVRPLTREELERIKGEVE